MKVLVAGSGGREHALAWKIAQSPLVDGLFCAPGNPGMANVATCVDIGVNDFGRLVAFAREKDVGLVVVGPEDPLSKGLVDALDAAGIRAFGPSARAAEIEASKAFAKRVMTQNGIPTAAYAEFTNPADAIAYIREQGAPIVVKADGLAAGKGVTVAATVDEAAAAVHDAMVAGAFGDAGSKVVIEECLTGEEASILAFSDGVTVMPMATSQDHKPVFDGDKGPNTGGMGAYSPAPVVSADMLTEIEERVLKPCVAGMAAEGRVFKGILYAGLMITADGPRVIEFNCRFGDPETQVVLPRLQCDIVPLLLACCDGTLERQRMTWAPDACVSVAMCSGGYPGGYEKGKVIRGVEKAERRGAIVFHAGTKLHDGELVTNGGRVLNVTALGADIPAAIERAYAGVESIAFDGALYRRDIGQKALRHLARP